MTLLFLALEQFTVDYSAALSDIVKELSDVILHSAIFNAKQKMLVLEELAHAE